jgi:alanine dehydrogenase
MYYVSEDMVIDLVDQSSVTEAVAAVYVAMASGSGWNFPVVRERLGYADAIFGFKSGFTADGPRLGVKAGGLWPGNRALGIANHQSTILLFDCETGSPSALVRGTHLTALRTAAASAISIRHLARADARTIGILGAGGQSAFQLQAALPLRNFQTIYVADQDAALAEALAERFRSESRTVRVAGAEEMARRSDVIITVTPSYKPVIEAAWVRPGTHLACMGADTRGKQEVETELVARANVFVDDVAQACTIGECQHAVAAGIVSETDLHLIGNVVRGDHPGRGNPEAITLFDSTGVGLQDIAAANIALELARASGRAVHLD